MAAIRSGHGCPSLKELRVTWCEEGQGPEQGGSCSAVCRSLDGFPSLDIMELSPIDGRETGALVASLANRAQAQRPLRKLLLSGLQVGSAKRVLMRREYSRCLTQTWFKLICHVG